MEGREPLRRTTKLGTQTRGEPMLVDWPRFKLGGLSLQGLDHPAGPGLLYLSAHDVV